MVLFEARSLAGLAFIALSAGCFAVEPTKPGVNRCHSFLLERQDGVPFDPRATQDFSLLADLNARFDDRCAFEDEPVVIDCHVGASSPDACEASAADALAIGLDRDVVLASTCFFDCIID